MESNKLKPNQLLRKSISNKATLLFADKNLEKSFLSQNTCSKMFLVLTTILLCLFCTLGTLMFLGVVSNRSSLWFTLSFNLAILLVNLLLLVKVRQNSLVRLLSYAIVDINCNSTFILLAAVLNIESDTQDYDCFIFLSSFKLILYSHSPDYKAALIGMILSASTNQYTVLKHINFIPAIAFLFMNISVIPLIYCYEKQLRSAFTLERQFKSPYQHLDEYAIPYAKVFLKDKTSSISYNFKQFLSDSFKPGLNDLLAMSNRVFTASKPSIFNMPSIYNMNNMNDSSNQLQTGSSLENIVGFLKPMTNTYWGTIETKDGNSFNLCLELDSFSQELYFKALPADPIKVDNSNNFSMVSGIAHDVKNALICIDSIFDETSMAAQSEVNSHFTLGAELANYALLLLEDVKDIELFDTNKLKHGQLEEVNLKGLLAFVVNIFSAKQNSEGKFLELISSVNTKLPIIVTQEKRLKQLLINIFSNAMKFTKRGFVKIEVTDAKSGFLFKIQDTGSGMTEDELNMINDPFSKNESDDNNSGWGIGLLIVRRLLTVLQGKNLLFESKLKEGTTVTFELPKIDLVNGIRKAKTNFIEPDSPRDLDKTIISRTNSQRTNINLFKKYSPSGVYPKKRKTNFTFGQVVESNSDRTIPYEEGLYYPKMNSYVTSLGEQNQSTLTTNALIHSAVAEAITHMTLKTKKRILLVDDCKIVIESAKKLLLSYFEETLDKIEIFTASDGAEAILVLYLLDFDVDCIISDNNMYFINGVHLCELLNNVKAFKKTPFFIFSGEFIEGFENLDKPLSKKGCETINGILFQ